MSDKRRFPRADALRVAKELCDLLRPVTMPERLIVAGSLRRRKADVGDVEILYVPRFEELPSADLFGAEKRFKNLVDEVLDELRKAGRLNARLNVTGGTAWGEKNKMAIHGASLIPVDLFTATEENWFNYLVCRTGPGESNILIASRAQELGWKWNPYGEGFSRPNGLGRETRPMTSEREVFEFVGLPYKEPWER